MPRDIVKLLAALVPLYAIMATYEPPDFDVFLYPWLDHIRASGPIGAFAEPFANYTPPYLYLLALFSLLPLPALIVLKLLAVACLGWLAFSVARLTKAVGCDDPMIAGVFVLCLPTVIFNGPLLGQCDALWAGSCLLALAAAVERRFFAMAAWAGLAFAFKAQAVFIAPVILGLVIRERAWTALPIPAGVYLLAVLPAWLAGWPLSDLLTIYLEQASEAFSGNAPNLWAMVEQNEAIGYGLGALAAVGVVLIVAKGNADLLSVSLLGALILPFVLPKMHERFFFLAEVLALAVAYQRRDRASIAVCVLTQLGTIIAMFAYLRPTPEILPLGAMFMLMALIVSGHTHRESQPSGFRLRYWLAGLR